MKKDNNNILNYILAAVLVGFSLAGIATAELCRIRILPVAQVDRGAVCLAEIAEVTAEEKELRDQLGSLIVANISSDTEQISLGRFELSRTIARAGINPASVDIFGASACRIEIGDSKALEISDAAAEMETSGARALRDDSPAESETITAEPGNTLADKLKDLVAQSTGLDASRLVIDWSRCDPKLLRQSYEEKRFKIKRRSYLTLGRVRFEITDTSRLICGKSNIETSSKKNKAAIYNVAGTVQYLCESIVAVRSLPLGSVITAADVKSEPRRITSLNDLTEIDIEAVIGKEAARTITANSVIQPSMIRKQILIKRNDHVEVLCRSGRVQISMRAKALGDGALGETISVCRANGRNSVISARVDGAGVVTALKTKNR